MTYAERKKIYDAECKKLDDWFSREYEEITKISWSGGLDGEQSSKIAKLTREMSTKARELGEKYEISPEDRS